MNVFKQVSIIAIFQISKLIKMSLRLSQFVDFYSELQQSVDHSFSIREKLEKELEMF